MLVLLLIPMCSYDKCSDISILTVEAEHLGDLAVVQVKVKNTGDTFGYLNNWTVGILPVTGGQYSWESWEHDEKFLEWNADLSETDRRTSRVDVGEVKNLILYSGPWLTDYKGAVVKITIHTIEPMCGGQALRAEMKFPQNDSS